MAGGPDGAEVLDVLDGVRVPLVAVLHTVLANPSRHQHTILARILDSAEIVVTMTRAGRDRLIAGWDVDPAAVRVIAHGAHDSRTAGVSAPRGSRPTVLTWGLLGEGKGIEWALEAVASVADLAPQPLYKVVGHRGNRLQSPLDALPLTEESPGEHGRAAPPRRGDAGVPAVVCSAGDYPHRGGVHVHTGAQP